jgi:LAO/AO transport system kinase
MDSRQDIINSLKSGDTRSLARCISIVENEVDGYAQVMESLPSAHSVIIGITGPPGAGKSTITDGLIGELLTDGKKVAVLCVDPSSPFNFGALLGDRIRMSEWYNHPNVFIRSLATRGSLGGLNPKIIEITEIMKASGFDYIIIETVGVGQSEIEIAGLADVTIVALVPEAGDEVQVMKAGIMEIADIFVVNKSDRPEADTFIKNLNSLLAPSQKKEERQVIKTIATEKQGIKELKDQILKLGSSENSELKTALLAEKAWHLIQNKKMEAISKSDLLQKIKDQKQDFNLYSFVNKYYGN